MLGVYMVWNRLWVIWILASLVLGCSLNDSLEQDRSGFMNLEEQNASDNKAVVTLCIREPNKKKKSSSQRCVKSSASTEGEQSSMSSKSSKGGIEVIEIEITNAVIQMKEPSGKIVEVSWNTLSASNFVFPDRPFGTNELTIYETDTTPVTYITKTNLIVRKGCDYVIGITLGGNLVIIVDSSSSVSMSSKSSSSSSLKCSSSSSQTPVSLKVKFFNATRCQYVKSIYPWFEIINTGNAAVDLTKLRLRYYFTADGIKSPGFASDYSAIWNKCSSLQDKTKSVWGVFQKYQSSAKAQDKCYGNQVDKPDTYLEIGFNASAGKLEPCSYLFVLARIYSPNCSYFNEADDYSFDPKDCDYADWPKVTAYYNGALISGIEPR